MNILKILFCLLPLSSSTLFAQIWVQKASMPEGRWNGVTFTVGGQLYMGTGLNSSGVQTHTFFKYDPNSNSWTPAKSLPADSREDAIAFDINGKGYVGTGHLPTGTPSNDFYQYDPSSDNWAQKANVGNTALEKCVGFALNGNGYIATGIGGLRQ